jgi:hypothetical protein
MTTTLTSNMVETLNGLLKTAMTAGKTYTIAIHKIERDRDREAIALRVIQRNHEENAGKLRAEIRRQGGDPEDKTGALGVFSKALEGVASLFGDSSAVRALREEEERALSQARRALGELEGSARSLVSDVLIPSVTQHIELLEAVLNPA